MRVKGHSLQREGRAHNKAGNYIGGPYGFGLCECGAVSGPCGSTAERQRWHARHKQAKIRDDIDEEK